MADATTGPQATQCGGALRGALFAVSALLLAGCQTIVPRGPTPAPDERSPVATPTPSPTTPTPGLPQDQDRHRVALLVPLSGSNAGVGQSLANAANLALLDASSTRVRITTYDTAGGAAGAAQRAIAEGARLILGPLLANDVRAAAPIAQRAGVPIVSFSNDVSVAGNGTFVMGYSPAQSIDRVVRHARGRGIARFAALVPAGTYGQRASAAMIRSVQAAGGTVVSMESFDRSPASLRTAVGRLAPGYEALLIADGGRIAVQAVPLVRRGTGAEARILGTELWAAEADIGTNAALNGAWFAGVGDQLYDQFARRYRSRYSAAPYRIASLGYDATLLVERIARDWRVGSPFPVTQLTDEGGFGGIDGAFRFNGQGTADRALVVFQVGQGSTTIVSPAPTRFDE